MEVQFEIWEPERWIVQYKTVSILNPSELLYSVIIGIKDNFENPFITTLISSEIYDLIINNELRVEVNGDLRNPISISNSEKKLSLRNFRQYKEN